MSLLTGEFLQALIEDEETLWEPGDDKYYIKRVLRAGRNSGPELLWAWFNIPYVMADVWERMPSLLAEVWSAAEFPVMWIGVRRWLKMFKRAGFVSDDGRPPPTEPITVWRGAASGRGRGMSWTLDRDKARWFADRNALWGEPDVAIYEAVVPARAVLAAIADPKGRKEAEIVVNPYALRGRLTVVERVPVSR